MFCKKREKEKSKNKYTRNESAQKADERNIQRSVSVTKRMELKRMGKGEKLGIKYLLMGFLYLSCQKNISLYRKPRAEKNTEILVTSFKLESGVLQPEKQKD